MARDTAVELGRQGADCHLITVVVGAHDAVESLGHAHNHRAWVDYPLTGPLAGAPAARALAMAAAMWREVDRLHRETPVDVVLAPIVAGFGVFCGADDRWVTVTRLFTTTELDTELRPAVAAHVTMPGRQIVERVALARAGAMQAASEAIVSDLRRHTGLPLRSVSMIPLGVPDQADTDAAAAPAPMSGDVVVLFVGRLERRKGIDVLLEAASRLVGEAQPVRFVVAGADSEAPGKGEAYRRSFLEQADPAVVERVSFVGEVSDECLWDLYRGCDVFCAPSRYESFGHIFVEAMMFGRPVVATRAGGIVEVVEHGVSGLLAEPGDAASLAEQLRRLIVDGDVRRRLGVAARARYERRFRLDMVAAQALSLYASLASGRRRAGGLSAAGAADIVREATGLDRDAALAAARLLMTPVAGPMDVAAAAEATWMDSADQFTRRVYRAAFAREPAPEEIESCVRTIQEGCPRSALLRDLLASDEARQVGADAEAAERVAHRLPVLAESRLRRNMNAPEHAFLSMLYRAALGREVDADGLTDWGRALHSGRTRREVVDAVLGSPEAVALWAGS